MEVRADHIDKTYIPKRRNFTMIEKKWLMSCIQKFANILEDKTTTLITNQKKNEAWDRVYELFHASPLITERSTKKQLQDLFRNLKKSARRNNVEINDLLGIRGKSWETMDSTVTLDGYDPVDKRLLQMVPLASSSDSDKIVRTIKCEVIEDDHTDNNSCSMISNSTERAVTSTPSEENSLMKKVLDIIENTSNSTDCSVTSTPSEDIVNKKIQEILKNSNSTPIEDGNVTSINDKEQNETEQALSSRPTSTTSCLQEKVVTSPKRKRQEPASSADTPRNPTLPRIKRLEEEHKLIKRKLNLEIESLIQNEERALAQHKYTMERMKREDEQSEQLHAAKLRALEAKRQYFESKMNVK